ncbi:putative quinol monooxygenase [Allobranchiibius sp. CTAmp26]|uniref:putative quinol monooxygenase n=1 Tax=Allobranchiibius sp. CTAmp26 TaxID=2815214 RepID=UPI001AA1ACD1|nr:antibiotic biosynthesis monooxygenase [Allobranchiibius sp. CTAmp26]MBO1756945.1 antibiotic biosynthesis monooxygenase [Allobranchiibius sp. CTAmp26]
MIIAAGHVYIDPADAEEFVADVRATYPVVRANPGNILISFCIDDPAAGRITVLEQWDSREALERHSLTSEVRALSRKWGSRIRDETHTFHVTDEHDPSEEPPTPTHLRRP